MIGYRTLITLFAGLSAVFGLSAGVASVLIDGCDGRVMQWRSNSVFVAAVFMLMIANCGCDQLVSIGCHWLGIVYGALTMSIVVMGGVLREYDLCLSRALFNAGGALTVYGVTYIAITFVWFIIAFQDVDKVPRRHVDR